MFHDVRTFQFKHFSTMKNTRKIFKLLTQVGTKCCWAKIMSGFIGLFHTEYIGTHIN